MNRSPTQEHTAAETLLTIKQVAARLAIGRTTVYELIAKQELKTIKIGRARRVPESALEQWITRQLGEQDGETIRTIRERYGVSTDSDAIRLALRILAQATEIALSPLPERQTRPIADEHTGDEPEGHHE